MLEATCLDSDQLHEFALGLGDADRFDTIAQHVEGCDNCQQKLERLDASTDDLVGRLGRRRPAARGDQAADDQWAQAVLDSRITADAGWDLAHRLLEGVVRLDRFELRSELGVGTTWMASRNLSVGGSPTQPGGQGALEVTSGGRVPPNRRCAASLGRRNTPW